MIMMMILIIDDDCDDGGIDDDDDDDNGYSPSPSPVPYRQLAHRHSTCALHRFLSLALQCAPFPRTATLF